MSDAAGHWIEKFGSAGLRVTERSRGVLSTSDAVVCLSSQIIDALKSYAYASDRRRARILFHEDEKCALQEMLIAAAGFTVWPPILNVNAPQSWTVFEGAMAFVRYRPPGEIIDLQIVAACEWEPGYLRFIEHDWYTTVPLSPMTVYLEVKRGPYHATSFADWGPQSAFDFQARALFDRLRDLGFDFSIKS